MKKLYYQLQDSGDLNVTVHDLQGCYEIIDAYMPGLIKSEDVEDIQFTITPVMLSDEEYADLGEWEGH